MDISELQRFISLGSTPNIPTIQQAAEALPKYTAPAPVQTVTAPPGTREIGTFAPTFPLKPTDNPLVAGAKVIGNIPSSAGNFAIGAARFLNPVNTYKTAQALGQELGNYAENPNEPDISLSAFAKEVPGAAYNVLVPSFFQQLFKGNVEGAAQTLVNDPVGQLAVPLLFGEGAYNSGISMLQRPWTIEQAKPPQLSGFADMTMVKQPDGSFAVTTKPAEPTAQQLLTAPKQKVGAPNTYSVGLTNVAGLKETASDLLMKDAKALYDAKDYQGAQQKYKEAVNFGVRKVQDAFAGTGIKVKAQPGFGLYEGQIEPNIDLEVTVPRGKEDLFHYQLANLADTGFGQRSVITYRQAPTDAPLGVVDASKQIYHEPMARITLKTPASVADVEALTKLMNDNGLKGGSFKDNGKTLDIINLSHYNKDYDNFTQQLTALAETLDRKGLLEGVTNGISETRHIGSAPGDAPITYKQLQGDFLKANPGFKARGTKAQQEITSKVLERLPVKETISKNEVVQLLKSQDIPQAERALVADILMKQKDQIPVKDLAYQIRKNLLQTTVESTDRYADYGLEHLDTRYKNPQTLLLRTGVQHGVSGHFGVGDEIGHIRIFESRDYSTVGEDGKAKAPPAKGEVFVSEIQADPFQQGLKLQSLPEKIVEAEKMQASALEDIAQMKEEASKLSGQDDTQSNRDYYKRRIKIRTEIMQRDSEILNDWKTQAAKGQRYFTSVDNNLMDERRQLNKIMTEPDSYNEGAAEKVQSRIKELEKQRVKETISNSTAKADQLMNLAKDNKYRKRLLEETLVTLRDKGYKEINLPTPSTVAKIEWGKGAMDSENTMPYEVTTRGRAEGEDLSHGDTIDYGGEDYTVVDNAGNGGIVVAPSNKVHSFDWDTYVSEEVDNDWNEYALPELEGAAKPFGDYNNPEIAQKMISDKKTYDGLPWAAQTYLEDIANDVTPSNAEDSIREKIANDIDISRLTDSYGNDHVFSEDQGRGYSRIWVVDDDAHTETFSQPSEYDTPANYSPEEIDHSKAEAQKVMSNTEMGVLDNYYDLQKNLKEIQKQSDIQTEYYQDDNGNTWIKVIPNKNLRKTAF